MASQASFGIRLTVIWVCGFLLISYPLLSLWSQPILWLGIPLLYLYLFVVWLILIFVIYRLVGSSSASMQHGQTD